MTETYNPERDPDRDEDLLPGEEPLDRDPQPDPDQADSEAE